MKRKHRLCAVVLMLTLFMSVISPFGTNAQEIDIFDEIEIPDGETFISYDDGQYIRYYGYTGNEEVASGYDSEIKVAEKAKKDIATTGDASLPSSVDLSKTKYFPAIGNQGQLGSCTFWAEVYYQFTYTMNKKMDVTTTPENTFSAQWVYNVVAGPDEMIGPWYDTYAFLNKQGAVPQRLVPYTGDPTSFSPTAEVWETSINYRLKDFYKLQDIGKKDNPITSADDSDLIEIKTALSNGDALACSSCIYSWGVGKLKTNSAAPENDKYAGEQVVVAQTGTEGNHRLCIVGYNDNIWTDVNDNDKVDAGEMGAIKLANSWGDGWGNNGYIWVSYDSLNLVSCVENAPYHEKRDNMISEVSGISVMEKGEGADLYLRYTINTSDRLQAKIYIDAEKDGTIYSCQAVSNEYSGPHIAYDGTTNASDATMVTLLSNCVKGITSENFSDYSFSVRVADTTKDSNPIIVKNVEIVDKNLNKIYTVDNVFPFTIDGEEKTLEFTQSKLNHAVVYYRGYKNPSINYKLTNGSFLSDEVLMEENTERRGYTHKFVIDLKDKTEAKLYFTDSNGTIDDNNKAYFTAKKGNNFFATENANDPLIVKLSRRFESPTDINNNGGFLVEASGGYAPYLYKYTLENLDTGTVTVEDFTDKNDNGFYYREAGRYRMTVEVKDFTDKIITEYIEFDVEDLPFEFEKFYCDNETNLVGNEITFTATTKNEAIKYTGRSNNEYTFEVKDSTGKTVFSVTKKGASCDMAYRCSQISQTYTPSKAGVYTITVSSTDNNKQYAEMSCSFKVVDKTIGDTDGSGNITVMDATTIQRYLVNLIDESTIMLELADCDKSNLVNVMDATYIQRYLAHANNTAFVGEVVEYIPPTELPTEAPTEAPTDAPKNNKVTFTNSFNWSGTMYCYYWSDSNTAMTTWPGKEMTYASTNDFGETMYYMDLPQDVTYIIFTNGSVQTTDISYSGGEVRYYPIASTDSKGHNLVETW